MDLFQFTDYINVVFGLKPEYLRRGQYADIVLYESYPEIYNEIIGNEFDPFYVDSRLNKFLIYLLENHVEGYKEETNA